MVKPQAEGPAQLKKLDFFDFVAGNLCRQVVWQGIRSSDGQAKLGANVPARGPAKRAN